MTIDIKVNQILVKDVSITNIKSLDDDPQGWRVYRITYRDDAGNRVETQIKHRRGDGGLVLIRKTMRALEIELKKLEAIIL